MRECSGIIAALPREIKHLVRGWKQHRLPGRIIAYTNDLAVVACAGMGPARASLAIEAAMSLKPVTSLLSVGLAGACDPALKAGDIVRAGTIIDSRSGERFSDPSFSDVLVSSTAIASVKEKLRLRGSYRATAVDMEAATVARIAQAHGLRFHAIKVISDIATFELQDLARFTTHDGQFREVAFAAHSALRPHLWSKLVELAHNSNRALAALTTELESRLKSYKEGA
jgi:adenosylhomocysteine nucleosidase